MPTEPDFPQAPVLFDARYDDNRDDHNDAVGVDAALEAFTEANPETR